MVFVLASLVTIVSLFSLMQAVAQSSFRTVSGLRANIQKSFVEDAFRELSRPLVLEAMYRSDTQPLLRLDSTPFEVEWKRYRAAILAQDVGALISVSRTSEAVITRHLPEELWNTVLRMDTDGLQNQPLRIRFARAGGNLFKYPNIETWISDSTASHTLNYRNLPAHYENHPRDDAGLGILTQQVVQVILTIELLP